MRTFYQDSPIRQKDLAAALDLSPQALNEILAERNKPNSETTLRIVFFLDYMNTKLEFQRVDPPALPRQPHAEHPDQPRTLHDAKERIAELNAQLKQRVGAATMTVPKAAPAPANGISIASATTKPLAKAATPDPNLGAPPIKKAPPFPYGEF